MKDLLKIMTNDNYIIVSRNLINELGLDEAVFLSELCHEQYYYDKYSKLNSDGFFFSTIENIEKKIGFKKKKQLTMLKKLKLLNLIDVKYHGMPKKRYIRVNVSTLDAIQEKYRTKKDVSQIKLTEFDYDVINQVFFENGFDKALKNTFSEYVLVLKQYKEFDSSLKNVRGLAKSLKQFEDLTIAEQKKIINQSKKKKWKNFYEVKEKKTAKEKTIKQVVGKNSRRKSY